ncbi:MAG: hypothetical protein NTY34_04025, partial [Candidatus Omnitrophica bacterium]|nr:hypothetical protein [Candidatus Omnitrophota bacterium]
MRHIEGLPDPLLAEHFKERLRTEYTLENILSSRQGVPKVSSASAKELSPLAKAETTNDENAPSVVLRNSDVGDARMTQNEQPLVVQGAAKDKSADTPDKLSGVLGVARDSEKPDNQNKDS